MSLEQMTREELAQLGEAQKHVSDSILGEVPMEYPGAPEFFKGVKYKKNGIEEQYTQRSQSYILRQSLIFGSIFYLIPYVTLRSSFMQRIRPIKRPALVASFICPIGVAYGNVLSRYLMVQEGVQLDSPIGMELRYQLWKRNPQHPFLKHTRSYGQGQFESLNDSNNRHIVYDSPSSSSSSPPPPSSLKYKRNYNVDKKNLEPYHYGDAKRNENTMQRETTSYYNNNKDDLYTSNINNNRSPLHKQNNYNDDEEMYFGQKKREEEEEKIKKRERFYQNRKGQSSKNSWPNVSNNDNDDNDDTNKQKWS